MRSSVLLGGLALAALASPALVAPAAAALKPGQAAPDFTLQAARGGSAFTFDLGQPPETPVVTASTDRMAVVPPASTTKMATKTATHHTKAHRATQTARREDQNNCATAGDGSRLCFRK